MHSSSRSNCAGKAPRRSSKNHAGMFAGPAPGAAIIFPSPREVRRDENKSASTNFPTSPRNGERRK
jgi:hypothetical protein